MFGPSEPSDPSLIRLLVDTGPDKYRHKNALKALATCEPQLAELSAHEPLVLLAHDCSPTQVSARIIAVTELGVAVVSRKKIEQRLRFADIAETKLLRHPAGIIVVVETYKAQNDFMPDDWRRHEHLVQFFTATPGAANRVCAAIDQNLN